ncbi:MAG: orotidine 5'-phosphate decarboxylase [Chloroflexi bacterium RBG_13_51_52]|nr:MAG: orotidine 5'-phosphate decarboxylase [Chloroflexi bacterium RBG_13_51_52]
MNFIEKLAQASKKNHSMLCVGLDPDPALMLEKTGIFEFNKAIIDATADLVCAYKPNIAFYEAAGNAGLEALKKTRDYIPEDIPVIIDAKRGDIGNTAKAYARSLFDYYKFDAMTASPYLGYDSLEPFINYRDRGIFILCRTSNKGALDFQSLSVKTNSGQKMLFEVVAEKVNDWNKFGNLGLVVGATYPEELKMIRDRYPEVPLLIPGVGAQGGELEKTVKYGADRERCKTVINVSRQILYASKGKDFTTAARKAAEELRNSINDYLK